jgi:hypothetical protein
MPDLLAHVIIARCLRCRRLRRQPLDEQRVFMIAGRRRVYLTSGRSCVCGSSSVSLCPIRMTMR